MTENLSSETGALTPTPPFDFAKTMAFLRGIPITAGRRAGASQSLIQPYCENGQPYLFHLLSTGSVEEPKLEYTLYAEQKISPEIHAALVDRLSFYLSLPDDLRPMYALAEEDPPFARLVKSLYGFHEVKFPTPFESACWSVIAQQVPFAAAQKMRAALIERYGCRLKVEGVQYTAFPEPAQLLSTAEDDLFPILEENQHKVDYVKAVAQAFSEVDETFLRAGQYEQVKEWLLAIKGIGPMASGFVLVRGLGRLEDLTASEPNLLETASRLYNRRLDAGQFNHIAARYGQYIGYWAYYLRAAAETGIR